jgi:hypothetical protein
MRIECNTATDKDSGGPTSSSRETSRHQYYAAEVCPNCSTMLHISPRHFRSGSACCKCGTVCFREGAILLAFRAGIVWFV